MATIGQSPRDDLVPYMLEMMAKPVEVIQKGVLDGLDRETIASLGPGPGEVGSAARLRDGSSTLLLQAKIMPRMQAIVDEMVDEGAQMVVILCGADWSAIKCSRLLINPGKLFPAIVFTLAAGRRLGYIKPSATQVAKEEARCAALGIDAAVTSADPYSGVKRLDAVREAARFLKSREVDLVWMGCPGFDRETRAIVEDVTGKPVLMFRTLLARIIDELMPTE